VSFPSSLTAARSGAVHRCGVVQLNRLDQVHLGPFGNSCARDFVIQIPCDRSFSTLGRDVSAPMDALTMVSAEDRIADSALMLFWRLVSPDAHVDASELMLLLRFPRSVVKFVPMTSPRSHGYYALVKQIRPSRKEDAAATQRTPEDRHDHLPGTGCPYIPEFAGRH
jgi:hypothetical protein